MEHTQTNRVRDSRPTFQMIKKIKYDGKSAADLSKVCMETSFNYPGADDYNNYRDFIFEKISFIKVMRNLKLRPEECSTGKYTHRMICPFKFHKGGRERTGSFRINEKKKTFTCFGCNEGGDILRFLQYYVGGWEQLHLEKLAAMAGLIKNGEIQIPEEYLNIEQEPLKETNHKILFNTGLLLRQYLLETKDIKKYREECEWADNMLVKIDKYFDTIDEENLADAQRIYDNLNNAIKRRRKE
jgi:DNA primase